MTGTGELAALGIDRVVLHDEQLGRVRAIDEFQVTVEQLLGRLDSVVVGLVQAGNSRKPPAPSASRKRGRLEGAVMLAAYRTSTPMVDVTHDAIKKNFGASPSKGGLADILAERVGHRPVKWADRAPAYAAAVLAAQVDQ